MRIFYPKLPNRTFKSRWSNYASGAIRGIVRNAAAKERHAQIGQAKTRWRRRRFAAIELARSKGDIPSDEFMIRHIPRIKFEPEYKWRARWRARPSSYYLHETLTGQVPLN